MDTSTAHLDNSFDSEESMLVLAGRAVCTVEEWMRGERSVSYLSIVDVQLLALVLRQSRTADTQNS